MEINWGLILKGGAGLATAAAGLAMFSAGEVEEEKTFEEMGEKLNASGLPETCRLLEEEDIKDCGNLTADVLKTMRFEGLGKNFTPKIENNGRVALKLVKVADFEDEKGEIFPDGIKVIMENSEKVTFSGGGAKPSHSWIKGTNPEFKINSYGRLERAWDAARLAEEAGLECPKNKSEGECSVKVGRFITLGINGGKETKQMNLKNNSPRKFKFSINQEGYNQGLKLTVKDSDILLESFSLNGGNITLAANTSYEVKFIGDDWSLSEK